MPVRKAKQYSDRGKISDLAKAEDIVASTEPVTPFESRIRKMFEFAKLNNDEKLLAATGIITTDYISDKNSLPLSVYRLRKIVSDIKSKSSAQIDSLSDRFTGQLKLGITAEAAAYFDSQNIIKLANRRKSCFWRVSK
jgi:hypothetical protein